MKKLISISIVILVIVFFRGPIIDFSIEFFMPKNNSIDWLDSEKNTLYNDLPAMDFKSAILFLQDNEKDLLNALKELKDDDDKSSHSHRKQLVCELALVYKRMAMQHLRDGNDDIYMAYIRKSQDRLTECTDLKLF